MRKIIAIAPLLFLTACTAQSKPLAAKIADGCATPYNSKTNYFPDQVKTSYAQGFSVEYHRDYKVVNISRPWRGAKTGFRYLLLQCGAPVPQGFKDVQKIVVPVPSVAVMSTTHLPLIDKLGVVDRLIAVSKSDQINTKSVVEKIQKRQVQEIGSNGTANMERILSLRPALVTTYGIGDPQQDIYPQLKTAGIPTVLIGEYMESSPLGRAEWLKFMALFFNQEKIANQEFSAMEQKYQAIASLTKNLKSKPKVLSGMEHKGTWYVPGGNSYAASFIADAGGDYLWKDDPSAGSLNLSAEQVLQRAFQANIWINGSQSKFPNSMDKKFPAFRSKNVYSPTAKINSKGGNDLWEGGTANPDLVLADLVKIFHPQVLPNHKFIYYQRS
jgi:iron complex transport system substrate-binding protein